MRTHKRKSRANLIACAPSKVALAQKITQLGMKAAMKHFGKPDYKLQKVVMQVLKRAHEQKVCNSYVPFTTANSRRRPRQVGAKSSAL